MKKPCRVIRWWIALSLAGAAFLPQILPAQPRPALSVASAGTNGLRLTWSPADASFLLENSTNLPDATSWQPVPVLPSLVGASFAAVTPSSGRQQFFRLRYHAPPPPEMVAPAAPPNSVVNFGDATSFLYAGPNPLQMGVTPGTIAPAKAVVLRGRVLRTDNSPLAAARISVLSHPELGYTLTRADGAYDLAANGGGMLTLRFEKAGWLEVQRQIATPWKDYVTVPDVMLSPVDAASTVVSFGSNAPPQIHRALPQTDADGTRQATVLLPAGTRAQVVLPDGSTNDCTALTIRVTELTVGTNGPAAMPAALPPTSAYTYCADFSADEADALGATRIEFNHPVPVYLENFLGFNVGLGVPAGYYDRKLGAWVPSANGRIIQILGTNGGFATVDVDGSSQPAGVTNLAALGITSDELQQLAALYAPGQTLWRVPITHFSGWDFNNGLAPLTTSGAGFNGSINNNKQDQPSQTGNLGMVENENQIFHETIPVAGTPFSLNYASDRVPGFRAGRRLTILATGATNPPSLLREVVTVDVAGQHFATNFPPQTNLTWLVDWNGQDAYGRAVQGQTPVSVHVTFEYPAQYSVPRSDEAFSFARYGNLPGLIGQARDGTQQTIDQEIDSTLTAWDQRAQGLGGWSLNVLHAYDPAGQVLYLGDGGRVSAKDLTTVATYSALPYTGTPANTALPTLATMTPDGNVYCYDISGTFWRIGLDGSHTSLSGPGGPLANYALNVPSWADLAAGPDGSLYWSVGSEVFRWDPNNTAAGVVLFAGLARSPFNGYNGDGIPATNALLNSATSIAVASDGSVYIADYHNFRIRKVSPGGLIFTIAGNGQDCPNAKTCGNGTLATQTPIDFGLPSQLRVGQDGTVYFTEATDGFLSGGWLLRKITPQGLLTTIAGGGSAAVADGAVATNVLMKQFNDFRVNARGEIFAAYEGGPRFGILKITADGIIRFLAGTSFEGFGGDSGPALQGVFHGPSHLILTPDDNVLVADERNSRIRAVKPGKSGPLVTGNTLLVASPDGSQVYQFDPGGRHLATFNPFTGATLYQFSYDSAGRLAQVVDFAGNVTTVQRDGSGNLTGMVGPFGAHTALSLDSRGFLSSVTDPLAHATRLTNSTDGLLLSITGPNTNSYRFNYDADGFIVAAIDPLSQPITWTRNQSERSIAVTSVSPLGHTNLYRFDRLASGVLQHAVTDPTGVTSITNTSTDGGSITNQRPDGTVVTLLQSPDPRFQMQAPLPALIQVKTPSGLTLTATVSEAISLADTNNPLSLLRQTNAIALNQRTNVIVYDALSHTATSTSPAGRKALITSDAVGRPLFVQAGVLAALRYAYDNQGRLATLQWGDGLDARVYSYAYDASGYLASIVDPLNHTNYFTNDLSGRLVAQQLPDGRVIGFDHDADGNVTAITPPGRPAYLSQFDSRNLPVADEPPVIGSVTNRTTYAYDFERQLTNIVRPDGASVAYAYDRAGRITSQTLPTDVFIYGRASNGLVTNVTASSGINLSLRYDGVLLTNSAWSGVVTGRVSRTYNTDLRLASQTVNGSNTVQFAYDRDGLVTNAGPLSVLRDTNGVAVAATVGDFTQTWGYNEFGEITNITATFSNAVIFSAAYVRDSLGRVTNQSESVGGATHTADYQYDLAGRLVTVQRDGVSAAAYQYDSNDNRVTGPQPGESASYDTQDRLVASTFAGKNYSYRFTPAGDLAAKTNGAQTTLYSYDALRHLTKFVAPDGTTIEYLYDGLGRRIARKVNGTLTQSLLYQDALRPVAQLDAAAHVTGQFLYAIGISAAPDVMVQGAVAFALVRDQLGSVRLIVNTQTGAIIQQLDYDESGRVLADTNPGFQPFGFAGGLYDPLTGLIHNAARDYDPESGRWTAWDPIGFVGGSANLYAYVGNDPVNGSDPAGTRWGPQSYPEPVPNPALPKTFYWEPDPSLPKSFYWNDRLYVGSGGDNIDTVYKSPDDPSAPDIYVYHPNTAWHPQPEPLYVLDVPTPNGPFGGVKIHPRVTPAGGPAIYKLANR